MRSWPALDVGNLRTPDLVQAALSDYAVAAIDEGSTDTWRVFFQTATERDRAATALHMQCPELSIAPTDVPDEDWAARSQASLHAVQVGDIVVAPPWDVPAAGARPRLVIVIKPSMGFGTGHHATTRLCLAALQALDIDDRTVIDVGTGSGVLALAAARLGARDVVGVDDDPDAIASAQENLELNGQPDVRLHVADVRTGDLVPADVVLANLTGGFLEATAPRLRQLMATGARLILSGLTADEEPQVVAAFGSLRVERRAQEDEWMCVTLIGDS
jgi:ribosomal protein L11 methyltransferase